MTKYTVLVAFAAWLSQGLNLLLGGHHDMTLSARCYLNRNRPGWRTAYRLINRLFFWQADHCKISFQSDVRYAEQVLQRHRSGGT